MSFDIKLSGNNKKAELINFLKAVTAGEKDIIANLSNASAVIKLAYKGTNWVGFYIFKENELVLGPFQGKPACIRIALGKGVCGTAAKEMKTQLVPNVHEFPGHIACDSASNSEIVVPIIKNGKLFGVLDMDSPTLDYFKKEDIDILEGAAEVIADLI